MFQGALSNQGRIFKNNHREFFFYGDRTPWEVTQRSTGSTEPPGVTWPDGDI